MVTDVRDTYSFICEDVKRQLDIFLYDVSQDFDFHVYESFYVCTIPSFVIVTLSTGK